MTDKDFSDEKLELKRKLRDIENQEKYVKEEAVYLDFCKKNIIRTDNKKDYVRISDIKERFKDYLLENGHNKYKFKTPFDKYIKINPLKKYISESYDAKEKRVLIDKKNSITCIVNIMLIN
jgi:hypothetical protein